VYILSYLISVPFFFFVDCRAKVRVSSMVRDSVNFISLLHFFYPMYVERPKITTRSTVPCWLRLPVNSSHSQLVTGQLVTRSTRHAVDLSQRGGQLVTSTQTSKHQSRTAAAVITLTRSPRSPPLLKKCKRN